MQSTLPKISPIHLAIIMDGNGRWAERRGLPRTAGHRAGAEAVRRTVEAAPDLGIATLTLFAFSADNWRRPAEEVNALMALFYLYLRSETRRLAANGIRLSFIGRRDRLARRLCAAMHAAEEASAGGKRLHLRIAIDYSSRAAIARAAAQGAATLPSSIEEFGRCLTQSAGDGASLAAVDLLIRTGGEKRLSDFLLWESAYAELCFSDVMWPDFDAEQLRAAVAEFRRRERRFGALAPPRPDIPQNLVVKGETGGDRREQFVTR